MFANNMYFFFISDFCLLFPLFCFLFAFFSPLVVASIREDVRIQELEIGLACKGKMSADG